MTISLTAAGSGYFVVYENGLKYSQHTAEREAAEVVFNLKSADNEVYYEHEYHVDVELTGEPTPTPPPDPDPDPEPVPEPEPPPPPPPPPPVDPPPAGSAGPSDYLDAIADGEMDIVLQDGIYTQGLNVPSGVRLRAANPMQAEFVGGDNAWQAIVQMSGSGSTIDGLAVHDPANPNSNAIQVSGSGNQILNSCAYNGGSHKHKIPLRIGGSGHLIEGSLFFGVGRYVVQSFICDNTIVRDCIARWDATIANEPNEPNATFSNYNSSYMLWENCISLDYGLPETPMKYGGNFYSPHNNGIYPTGNIYNRWMGCVAVNHNPGCINNRAFRADSNTGTILVGNQVHDLYIRDVAQDYVIKPNYEVDIQGNDPDARYLNGIKQTESKWIVRDEDLIKALLSRVDSRGFAGSSETLEEYVK